MPVIRKTAWKWVAAGYLACGLIYWSFTIPYTPGTSGERIAMIPLMMVLWPVRLYFDLQPPVKPVWLH